VAAICRKATVKAATNLVVLSLDRQTFVDVLGPLQDIMNKEKSTEVRVAAGTGGQGAGGPAGGEGSLCRTRCMKLNDKVCIDRVRRLGGMNRPD
jgi:hypothetical protein